MCTTRPISQFSCSILIKQLFFFTIFLPLCYNNNNKGGISPHAEKAYGTLPIRADCSADFRADHLWVVSRDEAFRCACLDHHPGRVSCDIPRRCSDCDILAHAQTVADTPDRVDSYAVQGTEVASHQSDTMHWRIERIEQEGAVCYLTKIYLLDPGTQIRKATANWERDIQYPVDMAAKIPDATLFINGSGYVSPTFPEIPSNYPGSSPDYYYTPLGSVTVTDGQLFRCLTGVPYYGLSLTRDGLHMHVGDDPADVLAANPTQTWSFYIECPVIRDHQSILDPNWRFTTAPAMRTIISCIDEHNFILLTVTRDGSRALTMRQCVDYLQSAFDPHWTYNLDGGPSIALYYRLSPDDDWVRVAGGTSKDADIMAFAD